MTDNGIYTTAKKASNAIRYNGAWAIAGGFATGANTAVVIDEISKGRYLAAAMWAGFGFVCGLSAKGRWASMKNATNQLETMIEGRQIK